MENLPGYFKQLREIEAALLKSHPGGVHVATLANARAGMPAGVISICLPYLAAQLVARGTHWIANPEQVAAYEADQKALGLAIQKKEDSKKQTSVLQVPDGYQLTPVPSEHKSRGAEKTKEI